MDPQKRNRHGGHRPGAGAPKKLPCRLRVALSTEDYKALLEHCHATGMPPGRLAAGWLRRDIAETRELAQEAAGLEAKTVDAWAEEPERADLPADLGAVVAFKVRLGGDVAVLPEMHPDGQRWVVCYFPAGDDASETFVECGSEAEAEIIARQTALARTVEEAGGHCLLMP
jgi:hypothetical protein